MSQLGDPILGLDIGTSTCEAGVWDGEEFTLILPDWYYSNRLKAEPDHPEKFMVSVFSHHGGEPLVGQRAALDMLNPHYAGQVVKDVKRRMDEEHQYHLGGAVYTPVDITAAYVKALRNAAAIQLDLDPARLRSAVVAVPASFGPRAQHATIQACIKGGLDPDSIKLVDEPIAAAYSLSVQLREQEPPRGFFGRRKPPPRLLVIDLGGGTCDVTLWEVGHGVGPSGYNELDRDADSNLGGLNWDERIAQWVVREAQPPFTEKEIFRLIYEDTDYGHVDLYQACQTAKETLSVQMENLRMHDPDVPLDAGRLAPLTISFAPSDEEGEFRRVVNMPSDDFLDATEALLHRCLSVCRRLFRSVEERHGLTGFDWKDLDHVFLAGGGSRLPTVQRLFADQCGGKLHIAPNPQYAVVQGAAMIAEGWRNGVEPPGICGKPRYPHTLGLLVKPQGDANGEFRFKPLLARNQELPMDQAEPWPVQMPRDSRTLTIRLAEREDRDGDEPTVRVLAPVPMNNLPLRPNRPGREQVDIRIMCGLDYAPICEATFRGVTHRVHVKDLL